MDAEIQINGSNAICILVEACNNINNNVGTGY